MNGVKDKFNVNNVCQLIKNYDIVIIIETKFNIRSKSPPGYYLVGRSIPISSKVPRGGVAIYCNEKAHFQLEILNDKMKDSVIFRIENSNTLFVATYIPPINSDYFCLEYFQNLNLILENFPCNNLFIIGDLNSRIGTPISSQNDISYISNPDEIINSHGRELLNIIQLRNLFVINGLHNEKLQCDSNFTYFRNNLRSQNDLCISSDIDMVTNFSILPLTSYSDHCPIVLSVNILINTPISFINNCAKHLFSYSHLDINYRLLKPINLSKIDTFKLMNQFELLANDIDENTCNVDLLADKISHGIYNACVISKEENSEIHTSFTNNNLTSAHLRAIADCHFAMYMHKLNCNEPEYMITEYANSWWHYHSLAIEQEKYEYNVNINKRWTNCYKSNTKRLWELIDWKGDTRNNSVHEIDPDIIQSYFKNIFQSTKVSNDPIVQDVSDEINNYSMYIPSLDDMPIFDEINIAINNVGKGTSLDGIPPEIVNFFPLSLREKIFNLMCKVFEGSYPEVWRDALLFPLSKKGHTPSSPKLRGISISPLLARIYDSFIDSRFDQWYSPNKEQAGFRKNQGCNFQLFFLVLMIEYSKYYKKQLYITLVDFEKAFDFANRAQILLDLKNKGIGSKFLHALSEMFRNSKYIPRLSINSTGDPIITFYGVTQGRRSSTKFFSFLLSDMASSLNELNNSDFMNPHCLSQLADDTSILAENSSSTAQKFAATANFSKNKYQILNYDKSFYIHMSKTPFTDQITCDNDLFIDSVPLNGVANFLGMRLIHSNELKDIVMDNIQHRKFNIAKYMSWLESNTNTPISIKIKVLDTCLFNSILYGAETWGNVSYCYNELRKMELNLLKCILCVKSGTSNDLVYHELKRSDVISKIKDRQFKFISKIKNLDCNDATVKNVWDISYGIPIYRYYENLCGNDQITDYTSRKENIISNTGTMCSRYCNLIGIEHADYLYNFFGSDNLRQIITRWRLSCHPLAIEKGRYKKPKVPPDERICRICLICENETHVIYHCPLYNDIRLRHHDLLNNKTSVKLLLNPLNFNELSSTAKFLKEIENLHLKTFKN